MVLNLGKVAAKVADNSSVDSAVLLADDCNQKKSVHVC